MLNYEIISQMYDEGRTVREIAEKFNTSPSSVVRFFKKNGKKLRTKSEATKVAIDEGRLEHPTRGKKRSEREKDKIGKGLAAWWKEIDPDALESIRNAARERWNGASEEEKEERQKRAGEALYTASREGSRLEKFVYKYLTKAGYRVIMHKKGLIAGEKYEIDLYLPDQKIAIEIDGPQHFLPLFGEERLQKVIQYDSVKNGTLVSNGLCVIRVKFLLRSLSKYAATEISKMILEQVKKIEDKFPPPKKRIIELETDFE